MMTRYMLIFALMLGLTSNIYAQKKTPNIQQDNALLTAIESNDLSAAKLALNNGASPNARNDVGDTALVLAIHKGNLEISKTLISSNATKSLISWYGKLPIVEAALLKQDFITIVTNLGGDAAALKALNVDLGLEDKAYYPQ